MTDLAFFVPPPQDMRRELLTFLEPLPATC